MAGASYSDFSRRERQIMMVVFAQGEVTATQVLEGMRGPPSRSAVRTLLRIPEEKERLMHYEARREFVYRPPTPSRRKRISPAIHARVGASGAPTDSCLRLEKGEPLWRRQLSQLQDGSAYV